MYPRGKSQAGFVVLGLCSLVVSGCSSLDGLFARRVDVACLDDSEIRFSVESCYSYCLPLFGFCSFFN